MRTAATADAAICRIVADRHRDRLIELLGEELRGDRDLRSLVGLRPTGPRTRAGLLRELVRLMR